MGNANQAEQFRIEMAQIFWVVANFHQYEQTYGVGVNLACLAGVIAIRDKTFMRGIAQGGFKVTAEAFEDVLDFLTDFFVLRAQLQT